MAGAALELSGVDFDWPAWSLSILLIATIAWMAHLLDRAKPLAALDDPADSIANPLRDAFVRRHRLALNVFATALGLIACFFAILLDPWLVVLVPLGVISVVIYGARKTESRRTRPKDVLIVKNALTGLAYATLIGCVLFAGVPGVIDQSMPWIALGLVAWLVTGDAMLSDVDDTPADAMFGTRTVSVLAGRRWAIATAIAIYAFVVTYWLVLGDHTPTTLTLGIGLPVTGLFIAFMPRVRTPIDVRGGVLAVAALLLMP